MRSSDDNFIKVAHNIVRERRCAVERLSGIQLSMFITVMVPIKLTISSKFISNIKFYRERGALIRSPHMPESRHSP